MRSITCSFSQPRSPASRSFGAFWPKASTSLAPYVEDREMILAWFDRADDYEIRPAGRLRTCGVRRGEGRIDG